MTRVNSVRVGMAVVGALVGVELGTVVGLPDVGAIVGLELGTVVGIELGTGLGLWRRGGTAVGWGTKSH